MRGMNTKLALAGAVALMSGLFMTPSANAISPGGPFNATTYILNALTDFDSPGTTNQTLSFPQFNDQGGSLKLQSMTLTLNGTLRTDGVLTNNSDTSGTSKITTTLYILVQDAVGPNGHLTTGGAPVNQLPLAANTIPTSYQFDMSKASPIYTLAPGVPQVFGYSATGTDGGETYTNALVLNEFTGTGNVTLNVAARTWFDLGGTAGNVSYTQNTTGTVNGTVTYQYASVPEATTMLLGGMAVMPILMQRRRRGDLKA